MGASQFTPKVLVVAPTSLTGSRLLLLLSALAAGLALPTAAQTPPASDKGKEQASVSYFRDIRPILQRTCQGCHQPATKSGDLVLTTYEAFMAGGAKGKVVVPSQADQSLVIGYLKGDVKPQMPFGGTPLPPEQIELFRRGRVVFGAFADPATKEFDLLRGKAPK